MEYKIKIEGTTPLLCNKFTDSAAQAATSGNRSSVIGSKGTPREIAETKLYLGTDGKPCIPTPNLLRCLIDAGKFFKAGKSKVTTQKTSLLCSCVAVAGVAVSIEHKDPWQVDERPVRIPSTGGRILAYRPRFDDWALTFFAELDTSIIAPKLFREIVDASGKQIGLGDFRPDCKGPYGRFAVTLWEENPAAQAAE